MLTKLPDILRFGLQDLIEMIRQTDPNINLKLWGKEDAKTATHLVDEVNNGECTLEIIDGILYRNIEVVSISIYYQKKKTLILRETEQIFTDGRPRIRKLPDQCSVAEKMKIGKETPLEATLRAINKEELSEIKAIPITESQLRFIRTIQRENPSSSYPGIITNKTIHIFECSLLEEQFNPEGYTEVQKDKTTYFRWTLRPTS
jgi:hypothetical protein